VKVERSDVWFAVGVISERPKQRAVAAEIVRVRKYDLIQVDVGNKLGPVSSTPVKAADNGVKDSGIQK
jgi:hypothetical protein